MKEVYFPSPHFLHAVLSERLIIFIFRLSEEWLATNPFTSVYLLLSRSVNFRSFSKSFDLPEGEANSQATKEVPTSFFLALGGIFRQLLLIIGLKFQVKWTSTEAPSTTKTRPAGVDPPQARPHTQILPFYLHRTAAISSWYWRNSCHYSLRFWWGGSLLNL